MGASKKRRRTKHRGNAAGMVETRGRSAGGRNGASSTGPARGPKVPQPPSWQKAATKALIPVVILAPVLFFTNKDASPLAIIPLVAIAYIVYIPLSYYSDRFVYNRFIKRGS